MARSQANLQFGILRGLHGLSLAAKMLYVAILVEPTVNQAGVGAARISRWARELELTPGEVHTALAELDKGDYVLCDEDTDEILVRTLIRNDGVADQPNVLWAAVRQAVLCESPRLRRVLAAELRKLPPRRPDKVLKSGRVFAYADPHATADLLDPPAPDGPSRQPVDNPSRNPSATLPEPFPNPSPENPSRTHAGTPGGGGGGGGGGNLSPVGGHLGGSRAHTREAGPPHPAPPVDTPLAGLLLALPGGIPDHPPRCQRCARLPADADQPCRTCRRLREQWQHDRDQLAAAATQQRQTARAAIQACQLCDENGMREAGDTGLTRCTHPRPQAPGAPHAS